MVDQITVFLENEPGRLAALCRSMADADINMHSLMLADTSDYGVARIICDDPEKARRVLEAEDYRVTITKVAAIEIPNRPGGLADLLECLDETGTNLEYGYCFASKGDRAVDVLKIHGGEKVLETLEDAGFKALQPKDLYRDDDES